MRLILAAALAFVLLNNDIVLGDSNADRLREAFERVFVKASPDDEGLLYDLSRSPQKTAEALRVLDFTANTLEQKKFTRAALNLIYQIPDLKAQNLLALRSSYEERKVTVVRGKTRPDKYAMQLNDLSNIINRASASVKEGRAPSLVGAFRESYRGYIISKIGADPDSYPANSGEDLLFAPLESGPGPAQNPVALKPKLKRVR